MVSPTTRDNTDTEIFVVNMDQDGFTKALEKKKQKGWKKDHKEKDQEPKEQQKRKQRSGDAISPDDAAQQKRIKGKSEENFVVYLQGETVKLTSRNRRSIKEAIASVYGEPLKYEVRRQSLKLSCVNTEQKAAMLQCTDIGNTAVEASIPRSEDRRNKLVF